MRVRKAKPQDRKLFLKLYKEHLEELKDTPGTVLPTEENLEKYGNIFDSYVSGELLGVVLLIAQDAFLMHGELGPTIFETNLGKVATGWGTHVREELRGKGASQAMFNRSKKLLREMGFDTLAGSVDVENGGAKRATEKAGFKISSSHLTYLNLHEEEE